MNEVPHSLRNGDRPPRCSSQDGAYRINIAHWQLLFHSSLIYVMLLSSPASYRRAVADGLSQQTPPSRRRYLVFAFFIIVALLFSSMAAGMKHGLDWWSLHLRRNQDSGMLVHGKCYSYSTWTTLATNAISLCIKWSEVWEGCCPFKNDLVPRSVTRIWCSRALGLDGSIPILRGVWAPEAFVAPRPKLNCRS